MAALVAAITPLGLAHAQPQTITEARKLVPADGDAGDNFGFSVAIEGNLALVGAPNDDDIANNAGAVYVYNPSSGALLRKVFANDRVSPPADDGYGLSVALLGGRGVIGAWRSDFDGTFSGSSYVVAAATGAQTSILRPFSTDPRFNATGLSHGWRTAISPSFILVGGPGDPEFESGGGSAYIYTNASSPSLVAKVFPSDPGLADNFGRRVALSDTIAVISSQFDNDNGPDSGSIYIFDPASGSQQRKVVPTAVSAGDLFGRSVSTEGGLIAVGAPATDVGSVPDVGAAYLIDAATGLQRARILPPAVATTQSFGESVALSGSRLFVGAPAGSSGVVYVYDVSTLALTDELRQSDAAPGDGFGARISVSGAQVLVGAFGDDDNGNVSGSAYVFNLETAPPPPPDPEPAGDRILVSARSSGTVGSISFRDEDIIEFDGQSWAMFFDGSDVGAGTADVNALTQLADGSLLLSFDRPTTVGGLSVDDSDVVRFVPTELGPNTAGTFELLVDGSDIGLTTNGEDIDALAVVSEGAASLTLLVSVTGRLRAGGIVAQDEDLVRLTVTQPGRNTAGTWSVDFDGSDIGLNTDRGEDVSGASRDGTDLFFVTLGTFGAAGTLGGRGDIARCANPTSNPTDCAVTIEVDISAIGLGGETLDALEVVASP